MGTVAIHKKRKKLSRCYQLVSESLVMKNEYVSENYLRSKINYITNVIEYQFLTHYFGEPPNWRMFLRKFNNNRTLPDFCVIGPIKSGTSDLAVNLMMHPNIMAPLSKEIYCADPEDWRIYYPTQQQKKRHADRYGSAYSPYLGPFLHWMELTYNLAQVQPNTKIVLILRDPVKRVYSHWKWEVLNSGRKRADKLPFLKTFPDYVNKALAVFPESPMFTACDSEVLQTGIYWKAVNYWMECFGRNNVLVLDIEDYFVNSNHFLGKIFEFVGLPNFDCPTSINKINENPISLPPPDEDSMLKLSKFYSPYNIKLWSLLGKEFKWCK